MNGARPSVIIRVNDQLLLPEIQSVWTTSWKLDELCHHYNDMHASKVDMLVVATVLALCTRNAVNKFEQTSGNIEKLVRLIAIVRANGMAITAVHLPPAKPLYPCTEDLKVGEMRREERHAFLKGRYFFACTCPICEEVTQPELLFAFRCTRPGCNGVVVGPSFLQHLDQESAMDMDTSERNLPKPGVCVLCGTVIDLEYSIDAAKRYPQQCPNIRN